MLAAIPDDPAKKGPLPTVRAIRVMHADGTLTKNLPQILSIALKTPHTDAEFWDLSTLYDLALRDPATDLAPFARLSIEILKSPAKPSVGKHLKQKVANVVARSGGDPKPVLDRLFGSDYDDDVLTIPVLESLSEHGHPERAQQELARDRLDVDPRQGVWNTKAFPLRLDAIDAKLKSGNFDGVLADLSGFAPEVRRVALSILVSQRPPNPQITVDQFKAFEKAFTRDLALAAWNYDSEKWQYSIEPDLLADTICNNYSAAYGSAHESTPDRLARVVTQVSRPMQIKIIQTLFSANDPNWVLAAARVTLFSKPSSSSSP